MNTYNFNKYNESQFGFTSIQIDNERLYVPRTAIYERLEKQAELIFRKKFKPGVYSDPTIINDIYQKFFSFYLNKLDNSLPFLYSKDWLVFTLFQYEKSGDIAEKFKQNLLEESDNKYWYKNGALYRQTADFLSEKMIEHSNELGENDLESLSEFEYYDIAWICSEYCVDYSSASNFSHMISQDDYCVEILPEGSYPYFVSKFDETRFHDCQKEYLIRANNDIVLRKKYFKSNTFEHDIQKHVKSLDKPLKEFIGMSYSEMIYLLTRVHLSVSPITEPGKIPMIEKEQYFNQFSSKGGFSLPAVEKVFDSVTLSKAKLKNEPRLIWNYKQQNRISKKPFLEITYKGNVRLLWSNHKLKDFFTLLNLDTTFKNFPIELCNESVNKAIDLISNQAGSWFESQLKELLNPLGIYGQTSVKKLKSMKLGMSICCSAGEIDFIGISPIDNSIVIFECKMLNSAFEVRGFRQTRDKFLKGKDSFVNKLAKKINWVFDNFDTIKSILCEIHGVDEKKINRKVCCSFITYFSSMAPCFFDSFPSLSLVNFIDKYKHAGKWNIPSGIRLKKIGDSELASLQL